MKSFQKKSCLYVLLALILSCNNQQINTPAKTAIDALQLKSGPVISCGAPDKQFGKVDFEISCGKEAQQDFNLAMELLHSFEYDEAEKVFAKIIGQSPGCAMAYWGVAMCNFHALWTPPSEAELQKGNKAIDIAESINSKTKKEAAYIDAIASFYRDYNKADHHTRCLRFEKGMEEVHHSYPQDAEAAILYALALDAAADPSDKTYTEQKKAGAILDSLYVLMPDHPGIIHYIIHTYDYPELAKLALPAARKYAAVAPSSAHALHMPSHIFTRLGLWDEAIQSNLSSVDAAKCYAASAGFKHWDEELHGLDYLVYAYLQKRDNKLAQQQVEYVQAIDDVYPVNFKVAYAFAAIPCRFVLENKNWKDAAALQLHPAGFPWNKFPWQEAIFHYTKLLGYAHTGKLNEAGIELKKLVVLHDTLSAIKDSYKTKQVEIQITSGKAWIAFMSGKRDDALRMMNQAADMEDSTEKHPVTPGEVIPARELLGDMLLACGKQRLALQEYTAVLVRSPGRFNSLQQIKKLKM